LNGFGFFLVIRVDLTLVFVAYKVSNRPFFEPSLFERAFFHVVSLIFSDWIEIIFSWLRLIPFHVTRLFSRSFNDIIFTALLAHRGSVIFRTATSGAELSVLKSIITVDSVSITAAMAAEYIGIRIIPFSFFLFLVIFYSIERLLTSLARILKLRILSCLINGHQGSVNLTRDQV
jgi:hypothetical protein